MIRIEELCFAHPGRAELFAGLNLELREGENVLLKGSNGCGKSTLLKLIVGLLKPQKGRISVAGKQLHGLSAAIFENILYQSQNTADNLLGINHQHDWDIWQLAIPTLPKSDAVITMLFSEMSSGMLKQFSQRILPYAMDKFWILDEPFASLDSAAVEHLTELLLQKSNTKPGMLIVSHEQPSTAGIFSRILELKDGRIRELKP